MKVFAMILVLSGMALATDAGAERFVAAKCIKCHTVNSYQIETTSKKDPEEITDLSNAGADFDEAALTAYLKKEGEHNGKKHKLKFKGEDDELKALVDWVLTLKE